MKKKLFDAFTKKDTLSREIFTYSNDALTLKSLDTIEQELSFHIMRLAKVKHAIGQEKVKQLLVNADLTEEQKKAVLSALTHKLSCIYGGPGTGKTFTAAHFLKVFIQTTEEPLLRIALTGPTGKATRALHESIQRAMVAVDEKRVQIEVKTLHALLGKGRIKAHENHSKLPYSLIIVDEASMIDTKLMRDFLARIPETCMVLFLGDPDQLHPVEGGEPFADMIAFHEKTDAFTFSKLTLCKRSENEELLEFAGIVKDGNADAAEEYLTKKHSTIFFYPIDKAQDYFSNFQDFQNPILTPLREGMWGQNQMNIFLQYRARKFKKESTPIIICKNDYELDLMNGTLGTLCQKFVHFPGRDPIPSVLLTQYDYAYALSVHKSQGSEFDCPILLLPPGSERFGKKMLYTAITRAKKQLIILSTIPTIKNCISSPSSRLTSLQEKLKALQSSQ